MLYSIDRLCIKFSAKWELFDHWSSVDKTEPLIIGQTTLWITNRFFNWHQIWYINYLNHREDICNFTFFFFVLKIVWFLTNKLCCQYNLSLLHSFNNYLIIYNLFLAFWYFILYFYFFYLSLIVYRVLLLLFIYFLILVFSARGYAPYIWARSRCFNWVYEGWWVC